LNFQVDKRQAALKPTVEFFSSPTFLDGYFWTVDSSDSTVLPFDRETGFLACFSVEASALVPDGVGGFMLTTPARPD
jgi:hypothetical protein